MNIALGNKKSVKKPAEDILKILAYFDLFSYPLTADEIRLFLFEDAEEGAVAEALQMLLFKEYIFKLKIFYSLRNDLLLADSRIKGNNRAFFLLAKAEKIARFLYRFPYVRGVGISGSLSKNFSAEKGDIDYFIITAPNKLWIARTCMHLFKKLTYLSGRQHWYCMNYYVDKDGLEINEMNIFTAMEIVTLLPVCGKDVFNDFFETNDWTGLYFPRYRYDICRKDTSGNRRNICFPNYGMQAFPVKKDRPAGRIKRLAETVFNNRMGDRLDNYLMQLTTGRWKKKEEKRLHNSNGNRMGIRTGKHFCKPAPGFLQKDILHRYQLKLKELEKQYSLNPDLFF